MTVLEKFIGRRSRNLLEFSFYYSRRRFCSSSILFNNLLSESSLVEELLDHYGAHASQKWFVYRETVATIKNLSRIAYTSVHIFNSIRRYHLGLTSRVLHKETEKILKKIAGGLKKACSAAVKEAKLFKFSFSKKKYSGREFTDGLCSGNFTHDLKNDHKGHEEHEITVKLSSDFLNLASHFHSENLAPVKKNNEHGIPDLPVETLRVIELKAHNLQSQYDTYIQNTPTERLDLELVSLRGHITIIF
ncbi:MAG TPA: hypothetical protein DC049_17195, partial [Spirochaetia bacterium]|nr:hypothetical protein [Spirochaetia bacterium]